MKKHEALKYAYDNYPKGTKYNNLGCDGVISISSGVFHLDDYGVRDSKTNFFVLGTEDKWAEIIPEKPERKFIMKSEDRVDLYEGDNYYGVHKSEKWDYSGSYRLCPVNLEYLQRSLAIAKAFSTKASAEKWIEEQNYKPVEIIFNSFLKATLDKEGVTLVNEITGLKQLLFNGEFKKLVDLWEQQKSI